MQNPASDLRRVPGGTPWTPRGPDDEPPSGPRRVSSALSSGMRHAWILVALLGACSPANPAASTPPPPATAQPAHPGPTTPPSPDPGPTDSVDVAARAATPPPPQDRHPRPRPQDAILTAPTEFDVIVETTKGDFTLRVDRRWGPHGADRFYNLVVLGYFDNIAFFRAIAGFIVQFGVHGDPEVGRDWEEATIPDDPVLHSNVAGTLSFAKTGTPDSATTQLFINLEDNARLDEMRFTPIARVVEGMDVVLRLHTGYGEGAPWGRGPSQARLAAKGEAYLQQFPELDRIRSMRVVTVQASP